MKNTWISSCFRPSRRTGLAYRLAHSGLMLLCGYLVSSLLELAMAGRWGEMYRFGGWTALALALGLLPLWGLSRLHGRTVLEDTQRFREKLYRALLERRIAVRGGGELDVKTSSDVGTIAKFFQTTYPNAVGGGIMLVCSAALLCREDWRVGLLFFAMNFLQLLPTLVYEKWAKKIYNQTHSDEEDYDNWMLEGHKGFATIRAYGVEDWYMARFRALNRRIIRSGMKAEATNSAQNMVYYAVDSFLNYGSYVILGLFVLYGGLDAGRLPAMVVLAGYLFSSMSSVFELRLEHFDYQEACKRLGLTERGAAGALESGEPLLSVVGLRKTFGDKEVLRGASCTVRAGEKVLLRGVNGSGKSTLLRCVLGVETPDAAAFRHHLAAFRVTDALLAKSLEQMSQGERKKFYLAAALSKRSPLLVLDEPTNHLDRESVAHLDRVLGAWPGALLVCTHGDGLAVTWDRTITVEGGVCYEG